MKARLGELQSRLQAHEEQRVKEESADGQFSPQPNGSEAHATPPPSSNGATPSKDIDPGCIGAVSPPTPPDVVNEEVGLKVLSSFAPHQMYATCVEDSPSWFMDAMPLMRQGDTTPYPLASMPTPPVTMAQTPNPGMPTMLQQGQQSPAEGGTNLSQSIIQDCLRFQIQLLSRMNSNPPDNASAAQTEELLSGNDHPRVPQLFFSDSVDSRSYAKCHVQQHKQHDKNQLILHVGL